MEINLPTLEIGLVVNIAVKLAVTYSSTEWTESVGAFEINSVPRIRCD
jgi:hypothetical protein